MEETKTLYSGTAVGGPMDGRVAEGRFPEGIVFVSKPENKAWIYDYFADQEKFYARPLGYDAFWTELSAQQKLEIIQETTLVGIDPTRELDKEKIFEAAADTGWDVRALPEEGDF